MAAPGELYHYFLIVRLQPKVDTGEPEAVVEWRFPEGELPKAENSLMAMITQFCFPDKEKFPKHNLSPKSKKFTFVVTNVEGTKRFGYVKRQLSGQITLGNQGKRWPVCHCILSVFPCHSIFDQILETTTRLEFNQVKDLMAQLKTTSLPQPGDAIYATLNPSGGDVYPAFNRLEPFRFVRPEDDQSLSGFADFRALLTNLDPFTVATVIISLLIERRVIFVSRKLSTLSSCVQASVALLYPFVWQHVFIPVLPLGMIQFVCAPVPFVVGLLASHLDDLQAQAELMDEVLLIDVEASCIVPPSSDFKLVPEKYLLPLVSAITKARKTILDENKKNDKSMGDKVKKFFNTPGDRASVGPTKGGPSSALTDYYKDLTQTDTVAKIMENAFIFFFAETMGHYGNYLTPTSFNKEGFLQHDPALEPFLRAVAGSQLFEQFIVQRQTAASKMRGRFETARQNAPSRQKTPSVAAGSNHGRVVVPGVLTLKADRVDLSADPSLAEMTIREGWLAKFGKGLKGTAWARIKEGKDHRGTFHEGAVGTFQSRYWKLTYFNLSYHKSDDSKAAGTILLTDIVSVNTIEFRGWLDCLEIKTTDRTYYMHSGNPSDTQNWFVLLNWRINLVKEDVSPKTIFSSQQNGKDSSQNKPKSGSQSQVAKSNPSQTTLQGTPTSSASASYTGSSGSYPSSAPIASSSSPNLVSSNESTTGSPKELKKQNNTAVLNLVHVFQARLKFEKKNEAKSTPIESKSDSHLAGAYPKTYLHNSASSSNTNAWSKKAAQPSQASSSSSSGVQMGSKPTAPQSSRQSVAITRGSSPEKSLGQVRSRARSSGPPKPTALHQRSGAPSDSDKTLSPPPKPLTTTLSGRSLLARALKIPPPKPTVPSSAASSSGARADCISGVRADGLNKSTPPTTYGRSESPNGQQKALSSSMNGTAKQNPTSRQLPSLPQ